MLQELLDNDSAVLQDMDKQVFVDELDVSFEVYHFLEGKTTCI